ncbi:hypothetical protein RZS08_45760, partial [Arthrospira platensis SPKY1]|nr:hypothetical protein [Arthrospira platensis SPKY1]
MHRPSERQPGTRHRGPRRARTGRAGHRRDDPGALGQHLRARTAGHHHQFGGRAIADAQAHVEGDRPTIATQQEETPTGGLAPRGFGHQGGITGPLPL